MTNLQKRIFVSIIGIIAFLAIVYYGFLTFFFFMSVVVLIGLYEFYGLIAHMGLSPRRVFGIIMALVLLVLFFLDSVYPTFNDQIGIFLNVFFVVLLIIPFILVLFKKNIENGFLEAMATIMGVLYVGWSLGHFLPLRAIEPYGKYYVYFLLFVVWSIDISAYAVGMRWGKHKIIPNVSPKKSVEGCLAGFVSAVVVSLVFSRIFLSHIPVLHALILGIIIGLFAQASDFTESMIKRNSGVKDSSNIIPGHGGVLDRFDSFIFTAPIFYYYIKIIL